MSADDQVFLDVLSSLPNDVRRYSSEVAEYVDQHVEQAARMARDLLASSPWIPDSVKPSLPPPPPVAVVVPSGTYERLQDWVSRHKLLLGALVLVTGTVVYKTYRTGKSNRKTRRARKARNGGRLDVVVIAGSPTLPLTRSLSLDMERKGFIIFIVCNTVEDQTMVQNMARPDIRSLTIDTTNPPSAGATIGRFADFLQSPHSAAPGMKGNHLSLKSVILIPSLDYQTSPIATIPPSSFADLFNTHLLHPILTIQAFLPLLTAKLSSPGGNHSPNVLVFTPSIISSINPPFHAPEATVCSALSAFTDVLSGELRPLGIPVTHMQLGTFDFTGFTPVRNVPPQAGRLPAPDHAEALTWPDSARLTYGRNFIAQSTSAISAGRIRGLRGSSLRDLHNAVFDVIDGSNTSGVVRIGLGADIYGLVGRWAPRGLVSWMMGIRKVDELATWQSSSNSSPKSGSEDDDEGPEYVGIPMHDSNVWKEG